MNDAQRAIIERVREGLARGLPGPKAQWRMAPAYRGSEAHRESAAALRAAARRAAVLILLYPSGDSLGFPLILRAAKQGPRDDPHAGQMALPGGAVESGESDEEAALRETREELGIDPGSVEMLGRLSELEVAVSGFLVRPCLGLCRKRPRFAGSPDEVEAVMETSLAELLSPTSLFHEKRFFYGREWDVPCLRLGGATVWGATAMILSELAALMEVR